LPLHCGRIGARAPTQITFGRHDMVTPTRFADRLTNGIKSSELYVFEICSHAPLYENVAAFNGENAGILEEARGLNGGLCADHQHAQKVNAPRQDDAQPLSSSG
jgi:hypothetical protein